MKQHGSLFSGIGGFDLAAQAMGWRNAFHCEINPFCRTILNYYWPYAKSYDNIITTDFSVWRGRIDVLTGGFPCQPYSMAGKRRGKADARHLWPQMLRAIREIAPRWVVGENVRGLLNWNRGLVFHEVQADLEAAGYEVFPFLLPAAGVGAPHERYRIWFVAYAGHHGCPGHSEPAGFHREGAGEGLEKGYEPESLSQTGAAANTDRPGHAQFDAAPFPGQSQFDAGLSDQPWSHWPSQSPVCTGDDGLSFGLDATALPYTSWRRESIKAAGNAVVPQVPLQLFRAIDYYETLKEKK